MYDRRYQLPLCPRRFYTILTVIECLLLLILVILGGVSLTHEEVRYTLGIAQLTLSVAALLLKLLYELLRESRVGEYRFVDDFDLEMTGAPNYEDRKRIESKH